MALDLSKTATKLLRKLASKSESGYVQLRRSTGGTIDDITGEETGATSELIDLNAAVTDMPITMVGDRIQITDKLVIADNLIEPLANDRLVIGGVDHQMIMISGGGGHAGVTQVYKMAARK